MSAKLEVEFIFHHCSYGKIALMSVSLNGDRYHHGVKGSQI